MAVVNGEKQLAELGARLQGAGAVGIRTAVRAQIRLAAKPLIPIIQRSARESLPKAGRMNEFVAKRRPRTSVKLGPRVQSVRITYKGKGAPSDVGPWRHPVFGNRKVWVAQEYAPAEGWWERAKVEGAPLADAAMAAVLKEVAVMVNRGIL
jgi:hypothetical protein